MKVLSENLGKVKLDKKDVRILKNLCNNYRTPLSEVARDVELSRTSVENRIRNMRKTGLVIGGRSVVNIKELGYSTYHVFVQALNASKEKELIQRVVKDNNVNAIVAYSGHYVLEISIMAKSPSEFLTIAENLFGNSKINYGCSLMILQTIKAVVLPESFFKGIEERKSFESSRKKNTDYRIDQKDIEIINILSEEAGLPVTQIAEKSKVSSDVASYRIKQLVDNKILLQFRPVVNYSVLGLTIHTLLLKTKSASEQENKKFEDYLKNKDSILWCAKTFGEWQYVVYLILKENDELHDFIQNLMSGFEEIIDNYELLFAYKEYKYSFLSKNIKLEKMHSPEQI